MLPNFNDVAFREYQIVSVGHAGMHKAGCSEETSCPCAHLAHHELEIA